MYISRKNIKATSSWLGVVSTSSHMNVTVISWLAL